MGSGTLSLPYYGCFSPFPHGTGSLSVSREYLALPDGPGGFTQDDSCPALLRNTPGISNNRGRGLSPAMAELSRTFRSLPYVPCRGPTTPQVHCYTRGLGSSPVARHYWGNHCCFLFLEVLRCFSSLGSPHYFGSDDSPSDCRVVPFGNPRVKGHLHLTAAYRSLSRPSSPP